MSDPQRRKREKLTPFQQRLANAFNVADIEEYCLERGQHFDEWKRETKAKYAGDLAAKQIMTYDLEPRNAFYMFPHGILNGVQVCFDKYYTNAKHERLVVAPQDHNILNCRKRYAEGLVCAISFTDHVRPNVLGVTKEKILEAAGQKVLGSGSTYMTFGRFDKYYPKFGSKPTVTIPDLPGRIENAMFSCGFALPRGRLRQKCFWIVDRETRPEEEERHIKFDYSANFGLPYMSNAPNDSGMKELLNPIMWKLADRFYGQFKTVVDTSLSYYRINAKELADKLNRRVAFEEIPAFEHAYENVQKELFKVFDTEPALSVCLGKMKADMYTCKKLYNQEARFYTVFPKHMKLIFSYATQAFGLDKARGPHSALGISFTRGGANALVRELDAQLDEARTTKFRYAYSHYGDDSVVLLSYQGWIIRFALDCSAFDLTQCSAVKDPVLKRLSYELALYDVTSALLWRAYGSVRDVVFSTTHVVRMRHGGPSGFDLQTEVNDMLMEMLIHASLQELDKWDELPVGDARTFANDLDRLLQRVGQEFGGFVVKLEQFEIFKANTFRETLGDAHFQFLGYDLYLDRNTNLVQVFCDIVKLMSSMPFPCPQYIKETPLFKKTAFDRLVGQFLNMGLPPSGLRTATLKLQREIIKQYKRQEVPPKINASSELLNPQGVEESQIPAAQLEARSPAKINEILNLRRDIWDADNSRPVVEEENSLQTARLSMLEALLEWSNPARDDLSLEEIDALDAERLDLRRKRMLRAALSRFTVLPRARKLSAPLRAPVKRVPTHPTTVRNFGRPPPTAVWGPDKPKKQVAPTLDAGAARRKGRGRNKRGIAESDTWFSDQEEEDYISSEGEWV